MPFLMASLQLGYTFICAACSLTDALIPKRSRYCSIAPSFILYYTTFTLAAVVLPPSSSEYRRSLFYALLRAGLTARRNVSGLSSSCLLSCSTVSTSCSLSVDDWIACSCRCTPIPQVSCIAWSSSLSPWILSVCELWTSLWIFWLLHRSSSSRSLSFGRWGSIALCYVVRMKWGTFDGIRDYMRE